MAFYPAIAVLIAQFVVSITQRIKWKYAFKVVSSLLIVYLLFLCFVPRSRTNLITFKYRDFESQDYPVDKATDWIKSNAGQNEKILVLLMSDYEFYIERIYEDSQSLNPARFLFWNPEEIKDMGPPFQKLKEYIIDNNVSYIMFPFSSRGAYPPKKAKKEMLNYLKENRDNIFAEAEKLRHEDNYIFIYKVR